VTTNEIRLTSKIMQKPRETPAATFISGLIMKSLVYNSRHL
jgi:hypothetical protein